MNKLQIKDKELVMVGDSWGFTVPMAFVKNGQLSKEKRYTITFEEA
jgi:hypothetical protein